VCGERHRVASPQPDRDRRRLDQPIDGPGEHLGHALDAALQRQRGAKLDQCLGDLGRVAHARVEADVLAGRGRLAGHHLEHVQVGVVELVEPELGEHDRPDRLAADEHRSDHHRLVARLAAGDVDGMLVDGRIRDAPGAPVDDGAPGDALADTADEVVCAVVLVRGDNAVVGHWHHHIGGLGKQVEAAGVVVDQGRQLGHDGLADLALAECARHPQRQRMQHLEVLQRPHRGAVRARRWCDHGGCNRGRGAGGNQLRRIQLVRLELVRRAHRTDQCAVPLAARLDGSDDDGVTAVAPSGAPLRAVGQDRGEPGGAQPVRAHTVTRPARHHRRAQAVAGQDPGSVEPKQLAQHAARRLQTVGGCRVR